jgi:hypothetical protein
MDDTNDKCCFYLVGSQCFCSRSSVFQQDCPCKGRGEGCAALCPERDKKDQCFRERSHWAIED